MSLKSVRSPVGHARASSQSMPDIRFIEGKEGAREALCNHCGGEAAWRFLDDEESRVEVICPDCGRFEMAREELDQAELDIAVPEERRE